MTFWTRWDQVVDTARDRDVDLRDIRVIQKLGGTVDDTELVDGLVLDQRSAPGTGPTRMEKARIGLIQFCISPPKTDVSPWTLSGQSHSSSSSRLLSTSFSFNMDLS